MDTLAPSYLPETSLKSEAAANRAKLTKILKYGTVPPGYELVPLAFETLESMGEATKEFIFALCRKLRNSTGDTKAGTYSLQRLSLLIRGNATSIMGTFLQDDGYQMDDVVMNDSYSYTLQL